MTRAQIAAALRRAGRRDIDAKTTAIAAALAAAELTRPAPLVAVFAAITRSLVAVIGAISAEIDRLARELTAAFDRHPDAAIYRSHPGLAAVLGPGKKKTVHARFVHNPRLVDALCRQAQGALSGSAGARAYYDRQRARGLGHQAALRQLANRLVGILHGCLRARTLYDEDTAWSHTARPAPDGRARRSLTTAA